MTHGIFIALNIFTILLNLVVAGINVFNFIRFNKNIFMVIAGFNLAVIALAISNLLGAFGPHA